MDGLAIKDQKVNGGTAVLITAGTNEMLHFKVRYAICCVHAGM
jgi:hypothetical protein